MVLPLIAWIVIAAATFLVVTLVVLYWSEIENWFKSWNTNNLTTKDKDDIGFTLTVKLEQKKYKTIQGVFNKKTNDVKDGRVIYAEQVDDRLVDDDEDEDGTLLVFE